MKGKNTGVYANGLKFDGCLDKALDNLIDRVEGNKASLIILTGGVGEGKTTLLVEIMDYINSKKGLKPIKLDIKDHPQLGQGGLEFMRNLRVCFQEKLPCVGYDEAGDFSKRGSLTQFNAMLNRTFDTFRAFKCIVVISLPNFNILDQDLFDKNIPRLLIRLTNRNQSYGNYSAYSLYRANLLRSFMKKFNLKNYAYAKVTPNFRGHFLDIDPERSKKLDKLSTTSKFQILRKSEVKIEGLLTYQELAIKLMKSVQWVRHSVANLKIKHNRIINKIKFFDSSVYDQLSEHLTYLSENPKKKGRPKQND